MRTLKVRKKVNAKIILADYFLTHLLYTDFYLTHMYDYNTAHFTAVLFHKTADVSKQILLENLVFTHVSLGIVAASLRVPKLS